MSPEKIATLNSFMPVQVPFISVHIGLVQKFGQHSWPYLAITRRC
jgi:hypothetical protein